LCRIRSRRLLRWLNRFKNWRVTVNNCRLPMKIWTLQKTGSVFSLLCVSSKCLPLLALHTETNTCMHPKM